MTKRNAMLGGALFGAAIVLFQQNFAMRLGPGGGFVCLDAFGCGVI